MPIYEYQCEKCGHSFEHLAASMKTSGATVPCPKCSQKSAKRKLSVFAVAAAPAGGSSAAAPGGMCGCGKMSGSCGMGN